MKPTSRKRMLPHPWLQNQWNARWTLRTCQTSLQCAWLISCIMLHVYMFSIRPSWWIPAHAEITACRMYSTYTAVLNLILLISRDAIHFGCCRYTHRHVAFLQADDWNQLGLRGEHLALRMTPRVIYPAGINTQPPRVPRLAITLSSSESVARSYNSLIWVMS